MNSANGVVPENPADKIKRAKEAREMGRKLREGKRATFDTGRFPPGLSENPTAKEALSVAVDTLRYMGQHNIANWCERGCS